MEDSFENRLAGHTPEPVNRKQKSGKGWMICFFITLVLLIGVGVFAGILFFNKNDGKVTDLEQQIKEKDAKIAELQDKKVEDEDKKSSDDNDSNDATNKLSEGTANIDINNLKSMAKQSDNLKDYTNVVIMINEEGKYIVAGGNAVENSEYGGYYLYMYKENKEGTTWKKILATQNIMGCDQYSQLQKEVLHGLLTCEAEDGTQESL